MQRIHQAHCQVKRTSCYVARVPFFLFLLFHSILSHFLFFFSSLLTSLNLYDSLVCGYLSYQLVQFTFVLVYDYLSWRGRHRSGLIELVSSSEAKVILWSDCCSVPPLPLSSFYPISLFFFLF